MANYLPVRIPGKALPIPASAAITAGQLVAVSGSNTVGPAGAASVAWLGVAAFDVASGELVTVHCGGTQELTASGAITAGAAVAAAANGAVATLGADPAAGTVVGVALTTAANGTKVRVQMAR
ncbi:capsid cement protein [Cumulibacter soli]|uniref:capsid cement protein n=1 Tax=Cumulibacter soli TaxID=2546344 RepID=UPI00106826D6|nr:capsid cement protein [Cumulibacter soli]